MIHHIGLLTVRNEADVLAEALAWHTVWFRNIVAIDGSTDGGRDMLNACPYVVKVFDDADVVPRYGRNGRFCDACRQPALDFIRDRYGVENVWVTLLHADEFWWDDPKRMAEQAHADGDTCVLWGEYRFFLHTSDRGRLDPALPVVQRLTWYAGPFFEWRQFRLPEHQLYIPGTDHRTLPTGMPPRRWPRVPRYRHYPYRSEAQAAAAYVDKVAARYWQPDHAWLAGGDPYRDSLPRPRDPGIAAWQNVARFDGTLPDPVSFIPHWFSG